MSERTPSRISWLLLLLVAAVPGPAGALEASRARVPQAVPVWDSLAWSDSLSEESDYVGTVLDAGRSHFARARISVTDRGPLRVKSGPVPRCLEYALSFEYNIGQRAHRVCLSGYVRRPGMEFFGLVLGSNPDSGWTVRWARTTDSVLFLGMRSPGDDIPSIVRHPREAEPAWMLDLLPLQLRQYCRDQGGPASWPIRVVPSQIPVHNSYDNRRILEGNIVMRGVETVRVPAGTYRARRFDITYSEAMDSYWLEEAPPHRLVRMVSRMGRTLELEQTSRARLPRLEFPGADEPL